MTFKDLGLKVCSFIRQNSSTILTGLGIAGTVGIAVTATKAGMKTARKIDELKCDDPEVSKKEIAKAVVPTYIPTVIMTGATIGCITGLYLTDKKKQAALVSACMLIQDRYNRFREAVDERGLDKTEDVDKHIREKDTNIIFQNDNDFKIFHDDVFWTEIHHGEPILCWDPLSELYFMSSYEDLKDIRYQVNRYYRMTGMMSANDYFKFLGIPETDWGDGVGWEDFVGEETYGYRWIDVNLVEEELSDGLQVVKVELPFEPTPDYLE